MLLLITKYNLTPKWVQLIILLSIYFILLKLHYFDLNNDYANCMGKGEYKSVSYADKPATYSTKDYLDNGYRISTISGRSISAGLDRSIEARLDRLTEVVSAHDAAIAPLVAEAKTPCISPEVSVSPSSASTQILEHKNDSADILQLKSKIEELQKEINTLKGTSESKSSDAVPSIQEPTHEERLQKAREGGERCGTWIDGCLSKITCTVS